MYEFDDDEELGDIFNDAHDIAQYDPVIHNQQTANNRAETPRAEREITRFSSLYPEEDFERLRYILENCDSKLEKAIDRLKELKKGCDVNQKFSLQEKQVKRLARSGVVPKRHTPEAIESKLEMILEMYPNANDTAIRHRLEDSIDLDLEATEIVNELETPEETSEDRNVSENNFQEINMDKEMQEYLSEEDKINLLHITQIFPDVDPHFLFEQIAVQLKSLETIVDEMTRDSNYPKLKQRLEKERLKRRRQEFSNSKFDIEAYLHFFEDPETYFNDQTRNTTKLYAQHSLVHLMNLFRNMREDFLQRQLEIHNNHFLPTFRTISDGSSDRDADGRRKKPMNFGMAQYTYEERVVIPWPDEIDEMFFRELQYLQHGDQIREFLAGTKRQREQREHEAEVKGQLIECQCCWNDNKLPEDMMPCQENFNHIFCRSCVGKYAEMQVLQGFHRVVCMTGFCSAEYNIGMLQNLLRSASMDILLRRRQQDELRNAQLDNMESCPFCDFAMVIENTNEKVFKCQNPVCLRELCRQCKEPNHIPLQCNEVEKDDEIRMRTYIENKMAEAWIRICPKCNKRLIKTDGCNALHCPCGAGICYVCNELLPKEGRGYGHFAGREQNLGYGARHTGQNTASKARCPLSTQQNEVNADVAERAGKEARALYLQENPNVEKEEQKMDDQRVEQLVDYQAKSDSHERHFRWPRAHMRAEFGDVPMRIAQHPPPPRIPPVVDNSSVSSASEVVTKNSESGQIETSNQANENEPKTTENSVIQRSSSPVTSDSHLTRSFPVHHNTQRKYSDYVPQPFFGIIRRLNLLSYKPSLARFSLEEVCSMTKDDIIEKVEVQSGDLDKLIEAIAQLRHQLGCNGINRGGQNAFYNHRKPLLHTVIRTQNSTPEENWDNEALNGPSLIRPRSSSSASPSKIPTNPPVRNGLSGSADDVARGLPAHRGFHGSRGRGRFFSKVTPTQGWLQSETEFPPMGHQNNPSQGLTQSLTLPSQTLSLLNSQSVSLASTDDCEILPIEQQMTITPPNFQKPPPSTQMVWSQAAPQSSSWFQNPKNPIHATSWLPGPGVIQPTPQIPFSTTMSCHCGRHGCVLCHPTFRPMMLANNYLHNPHPQNMLQALAAIGAMPLPMPMGILPPQHFPLEEQARFHQQESMDERMMMGQQHMKKMPGGGTESCCNCGQQHPFDLCQQPSLRDLTKSGEYRLNFDGDSAPADNSESVKT